MAPSSREQSYANRCHCNQPDDGSFCGLCGHIVLGRPPDARPELIEQSCCRAGPRSHGVVAATTDRALSRLQDCHGRQQVARKQSAFRRVFVPHLRSGRDVCSGSGGQAEGGGVTIIRSRACARKAHDGMSHGPGSTLPSASPRSHFPEPLSRLPCSRSGCDSYGEAP